MTIHMQSRTRQRRRKNGSMLLLLHGLCSPPLLLFLLLSSPLVCDAFMIQDQQTVLAAISSCYNQQRKGRLRDCQWSNPVVTAYMAIGDNHDAFDDTNRSSKNATSNLQQVPDSTTSSNSSNSSLTSKKSASSRSQSPKLLLQKRVSQLESLVASQAVLIKRLQDETKRLGEQTAAFAHVVDLLRQAGLRNDNGSIDAVAAADVDSTSNDSANKDDAAAAASVIDSARTDSTKQFLESMDDAEIFGKAPSSVIEAADAAGAAILAGVLAGKKRLLVDVRDAELNTDVETLVQFIELAILPVAAGLEGMNTKRNRLKIVFPTVSQLLDYRKRMALSAPEVVALSTLGFDPVEQRDNLVVIVAPFPDDEEGLVAMNELLEPTSLNAEHIDQPLVVLNHHMIPLSGPAAKFEVAYHLRLLSVQYVSGEDVSDDVSDAFLPGMDQSSNSSTVDADVYDAAVEAAMEHAKAIGANHGVTRAMVIRSFPKPWHVFVDLSPDTDADFEVAATFDEEPTPDEVNHAIVECLEGSEEEDELVAQQMQQALENGQLDRVSEMLGSMGIDFMEEEAESDDEDNNEGENWDLFGEDSV